MINVQETMPHDANFAPTENYGPNHQGRISAKDARALCGMYGLPLMGYETVVAVAPGARLYVANISGAYVLRSPSIPVDAWPDVFKVTLKRRASIAHLAAQLRLLALGETITADDYSALRNLDAATSNDKDAMQRAMHGNALPEDAARLASLAHELDRKTV